MVYLRPSVTDENVYMPPNWLCGGVIIDERYIITSAACIEDVTFFYVVSGTHKWLPPTETNECIQNGAMRAIWKCVPRTYRYDGNYFNNIRWMVKDIAVVMTEGKISFDKRVKGCDFIPHKIAYNNFSKDLENPGTQGFIAGWGSTDRYIDAADIFARTSVNSPVLMETSSVVIQKASCKSHWLPRYHSIIDKYMICGKSVPTNDMLGECEEQQAKCRQLVFSEEEGPRSRRFETNPEKLLLDSAARVKKSEQMRKVNNTRRNINNPYPIGGFCENDHGGPLVVGQGRSAVVVGIISAYKTQNNTKRCFGPFLYTSVYNNRKLIQCALYKEIGTTCKVLLRESSTVIEEEIFDWGDVNSNMTVLKYEDPVDYPQLRSSNDSISDQPDSGSKNDTTIGTTKT